ncbi:hypothetical protein OPW33_24930 [Vibrio europaeus]|uniref:hypothetical protein n=1 Tax=Vibrio europaeus TaxID=300876 RepID=UPI002341A905|nr:hypothetical protein [Vibrio europaeus]MDC5842551.1 hypothetical protein [Vibrio europaeus]
MQEEIVPLSVICAIVLFIAREINDYRKSKNKEIRHRRAIKLILADEIKQNFLTLERLSSVMPLLLKGIEYAQKDIPFVRNAHTDRYGNDVIKFHIGENGEYGQLLSPIPHFSMHKFEAHLKDTVLLEPDVHKYLTNLYQELNFCSNIRNELVVFLSGESPLGHWAFANRVESFDQQKEQYFELLQEAHILLVGTKLEVLFRQVKELKP